MEKEKNGSRNMLMICYYYPPLTDVGCKRSVAFSKYLKKHGWNPSVLTVKNPDKAYCLMGNDPLPPGITTEYSYSIINLAWIIGILNSTLSKSLSLLNVTIKKNYFYQIFCIPDLFWGWIPLTTIKGLRLIKKNKIDIIYVSCTPYSSAIAGIMLKFLTRKPLILDFRDPFALEVTYSFRVNDTSKYRININRRIMSFFLRYTDIFIVNNEATKKMYINEYPVKEKIYAIHNGFDSEYLIQRKAEKYPRFTIVYTGEFYFWASRSESFFNALASLKQKGKINKDNFQFLFYGGSKKEIEKIALAYGIEDLVSASPRIPYSTILDVISKSHLQFLKIAPPMISTKLFEGIPLNIPFLSITPGEEVEEIIRKYSPSSYVTKKDSAEEVADAISDAISKYRDGQIKDNHIQEFLANFSRENLTLKLMNIIDQNLYKTEFQIHSC